jgi:hypothetical protein
MVVRLGARRGDVAIPPIALAMSAAVTGSVTSLFESPNSVRIESSAKLKRRKSVASIIHPSCGSWVDLN